ncbi:MAG TPA: NADH-quinone oxidoreductase subunit N [Pirellulaceae bacterium]
MNLHDLVSQLIIDTRGAAGALFSAPTADSSLSAFLPELVLCATILLLLLVRLPRLGWKIDTFWIALAGSIVALCVAAPWDHLRTIIAPDQAANPAAVTRMEIFTGMLVYDTFSVYVRSLLFAFAVLLVIFTKITGIPDREDGPDIYSLFFGATIGMCLMASANHLLTVFMAVEMASVPSYVLAGILKGRRVASEAALKYSVYGAGAAGVMLYGISLLAGLLNTAHLPTIAVQLAEKFANPVPPGELMVLALAGLLISVGLAFKLSAVPFHFWCPDVFEGATAEVNAFLSIASKAAALALLVRVALGVGAIPPTGYQPGQRTAIVRHEAEEKHLRTVKIDSDKYFVASTLTQEPSAAPVTHEIPQSSTSDQNSAALEPIRSFTAKLIAFFAIITCTFGNLAAYGQNNIKRLLAYSTIAHAGYMMMPISAAVAMAGIDAAGAERAIAALAIYMAVYLFMNLAAFAVVALLRNAMRSEDVNDYAGLIRRSPLTVVCFAATLFSLIGLPPLSGFVGKFAIFAALVDGYQKVESAGLPGFYLLLLLIVGGLNTAISLFYYLRVVKIMTIDDEPRDRPPLAYSDVSLGGAFLWVITLPTALLIISWDWLSQVSLAAASHLFG